MGSTAEASVGLAAVIIAWRSPTPKLLSPQIGQLRNPLDSKKSNTWRVRSASPGLQSPGDVTSPLSSRFRARASYPSGPGPRLLRRGPGRTLRTWHGVPHVRREYCYPPVVHPLPLSTARSSCASRWLSCSSRWRSLSLMRLRYSSICCRWLCISRTCSLGGA